MEVGQLMIVNTIGSISDLQEFILRKGRIFKHLNLLIQIFPLFLVNLPHFSLQILMHNLILLQNLPASTLHLLPQNIQPMHKLIIHTFLFFQLLSKQLILPGQQKGILTIDVILIDELEVMLFVYQHFDDFLLILFYMEMEFNEDFIVQLSFCHNQLMNVFYFVNKWPKGGQFARFQKANSLIQTLINNGNNITLLSSDSTDPDDIPDLEKVPIEKTFLHPKKIMQGLSTSPKKPDLAIFNSYQTEQLYSIFMYSRWNKCPRVLEINHLQGLEEWRKRNYFTMGSPFLHTYDVPMYPETSAPLSQKFNNNELQSIKRSDYFLCGNDFISFYLNKHLSIKNYVLHSMGLPINDFRMEISDLEYREHRHRKHFVFLGNFHKDKNVGMINQLVERIWPVIRKELPDVQLHIYGAGRDKTFISRKKQLEKMGVHLKGYMEDTQELQKYRAMLYPAQYSTGTKGAIVQSWFQHTPVITTPIGAQGLFFETSQPLFSADSKGECFNGFFKERMLTKEEQNERKDVYNYYENGALSDQINNFKFGGLCNSFSYSEFIQNSIKIYKDEKLWRQCLLTSRRSFLRNHGEQQMEINLKYGFSQVEYAVYESRRRKEYSEEWDKYVKSREVFEKLRQRSK